MKLLIITQVVDRNDHVLGFFHRWIEEFAKLCEAVTVICLREGEHRLPGNVRVLSLGKERGRSRISYVASFYTHLFRERKNYDAVFVHMNQEYVLLGGLPWRLMGKKILFWRNHHAGSPATRLAMALSNVLLCTSRYSFTAGTSKTALMPVGIDTDAFKRDPSVARTQNAILSLGRIAPVKKIDRMLEAFRALRSEGVEFTADIYGDPLPADASYAASLKESTQAYGLESRVRFFAGVQNAEAPRLYNAHDIFINASSSGMYDKTIFEAMACESLVLVSNRNLEGEIDPRFLFREGDPANLAGKLKRLSALSGEERRACGMLLRTYAVERHGLRQLAERVCALAAGKKL